MCSFHLGGGGGGGGVWGGGGGGFFFQAEDGIRDDLVTGVQTCALPISCTAKAWRWHKQQEEWLSWLRRSVSALLFLIFPGGAAPQLAPLGGPAF